MFQRLLFLLSRAGLASTVILFACYVPPASAQMGSAGTVNVLVFDSSGAAVQGANLVLQDLATNDSRTMQTPETGTGTFAIVPLGTYKLTVTKTGFETQVINSVVVEPERDFRSQKDRSRH